MSLHTNEWQGIIILIDWICSRHAQWIWIICDSILLHLSNNWSSSVYLPSFPSANWLSSVYLPSFPTANCSSYVYLPYFWYANWSSSVYLSSFPSANWSSHIYLPYFRYANWSPSVYLPSFPSTLSLSNSLLSGLLTDHHLHISHLSRKHLTACTLGMEISCNLDWHLDLTTL